MKGGWQVGTRHARFRDGETIIDLPALVVWGMPHELNCVLYFASSCVSEQLVIEKFCIAIAHIAPKPGPSLQSHWIKRTFKVQGNEYYAGVRIYEGSQFDMDMLILFYSFQTFMERYHNSRLFRLRLWLT